MFFRTAFPSFLFVVALVASATAGLQTWRLSARNADYAVLAQKATARARDAKPVDAAKLKELTADLAAARQQLSSAETAITEAEARLSEEVSAHAALKAKAEQSTAALADAERKAAVARSEADAARLALQRSAKATGIETTGSITPSPPTATAVAAGTPPVTEAAKPVAAAPAAASEGKHPAKVRRAERRAQAKTVSKRGVRPAGQGAPASWMMPYVQ